MYDTIELPMSYEQLRTVVVKTLQKVSSAQLNDLRIAVPSVAIAMGLVTPRTPPENSFGREVVRHGITGSGFILSDADAGRVNSIIWDLLIEGVIRPGSGSGMNAEFPFFHVTEWGKQVLKDGPHSPYDPDGFIKKLVADIPTLDRVIITYLNESLHTFRIGCLLSSTIALGCASEKALLLLIGAYRDSLPEKSREKFRNNTEDKMIKRQFDEFRKMLDGELRARLSPEIADGIDVEFNALFDFIRNQRNDAGHPTGISVERERAYANLLVLPLYLRKVYSLISWVAANPKI